MHFNFTLMSSSYSTVSWLSPQYLDILLPVDSKNDHNVPYDAGECCEDVEDKEEDYPGLG